MSIHHWFASIYAYGWSIPATSSSNPSNVQHDGRSAPAGALWGCLCHAEPDGVQPASRNLDQIHWFLIDLCTCVWWDPYIPCVHPKFLLAEIHVKPSCLRSLRRGFRLYLFYIFLFSDVKDLTRSNIESPFWFLKLWGPGLGDFGLRQSDPLHAAGAAGTLGVRQVTQSQGISEDFWRLEWGKSAWKGGNHHGDWPQLTAKNDQRCGFKK